MTTQHAVDLVNCGNKVTQTVHIHTGVDLYFLEARGGGGEKANFQKFVDLFLGIDKVDFPSENYKDRILTKNLAPQENVWKKTVKNSVFEKFLENLIKKLLHFIGARSALQN